MKATMLHTPGGYATDRMSDWLMESTEALERIALALNGGTVVHPERVVREIADKLIDEGTLAPGSDRALARVLADRADWTEIADRYMYPR